NFALIRDTETLETRPAPLFDTGASLWAGELRVSNADYQTRPFYTTVKSPTARRQLHLIRNWDRYDMDVLDDWPDAVAQRLNEYGLMAESRVEQIRRMLHERVRQARQARDGRP
ncbi:MAG: toxin HipA, partial [Bifidobacterium castoris]|nr:toxin HipA [Bifidobacterium castoris]